MNRNIWVAAALAASAGGALAAQDRPAQKITVTGCVERADQVASRENLGTTVDSLTYVLIKAQDGAADRNRAAAAAPPSLGANEESLGKIYRLEVDRDTMNEHVGHRVEIVAAVAASAAPDAQPVGTAGTLSDSRKVDAATPVLLVESVKMLSSTCPRD